MPIRDVTPADFAAIAALTNHYILNTSVHFGMEAVQPADLESAWRSAPHHPYMVMTDDAGVFMGFAKAGVWRERAAYRHTAEVGIYIERGHEGKGAGKALYRALIDRCRAAGFHTLVGGLTLPNDASVRLHEAVGFKHVATFKEVGRKFDRWHDVAFYQLML